MKLLFLVNDPDFFLSHRLVIGLAAQAEGFSVHVAAPETGDVEGLKRLGFHFHPMPMSRSRGLLHREVQSLLAIIALYRRLGPDIVHHVTIKPVIYGSLAARLAGIPSVVNALSGLGHVFIQKGWKAAIRRKIVCQFYRLALRHPWQKVIFQNPDDSELFLTSDLVRERDIVLIRGSGVDPEKFRPLPLPEEPPVVMLPARMLWEKGIREFIEAAGIIRSRGIAARFVLVGDPDPGNPASATVEWLNKVRDEGSVEWWGHKEDMHIVLNQSHIVCLPSYREGLPKVLIEAAACGRPIVTTDVPGCREIVIHGENGLRVPSGDGWALSAAILILLKDPELRSKLGRRGREMVISEFSESRVVKETLDIYRHLLNRGARGTRAERSAAT